MSRTYLTDWQKAALCRDYIAGMTPKEISMKYGVATNTIWYILQRNNVRRRKQIIPDE